MVQAAVCQTSETQPTAYTNPVLRGFNPDPSICRVGEDYYLISSSSYLYPGVPIYHSRDLVHWKCIGHCLTRPEQFFPDKNNNRPELYAGTLRYNKGVFYMVTTEVRGGGNFFVTAAHPAGPWSAPVAIDRAVFDPSLFFDDNGKVYYTRRGEFADKDIVQAEIDMTTGKLLTPLKSISHGLVGDDTEGPHLFTANGRYYLTMGEGGSRYLHMQSIARSKSPWGPWEKCPHNPVMCQHNGWWHHTAAIGHADFLQDHTGKWWAVCLGQRKAGYMDFCAIGRETFLLPVQWVDGWPHVELNNLTHLNVEAQTLPLQPWPADPIRDDFSEPTLALKWNLMAYPSQEVYSLTQRPGFLRLNGTENALEQSKQVAFVGTRQLEMAGELVAKMEFTPASENEEAGVAIYQNPAVKYSAFITIRGGKKVAVLRKTILDMVQEIGTIPAATNSVYLKMSFDQRRYTFSIAEKEGDWKHIGSGSVNLASTDVAGSFGGAIIGVYASGNGKPCNNPADFDWIETDFHEAAFK